MPKDTVMHLTPGSYAAPAMLETRLAKTDFQEDYAMIGARLRERLDADFTVFSPEAATDNLSVIDEWLQHYEARFLTILPDVFFEQFPSLRSKYQGQSEIADLALSLLEKVREDLRRYALRRLATWWSANNYPNGAGMGEPEKAGQHYIVPVFSLRDNRIIGRITLSPSGGVIADQTTTGRQLRELLSRAA